MCDIIRIKYDTMKNKYKNSGFYVCEKCKLHIKVLSKSRHQGMSYPKRITICPQCGWGVKLVEFNIFDKVEHQLWINVIKNQIRYSLKYPVDKNLLEKASTKEV